MIPGWGADLDPKDRPGVPRERFITQTGAHWEEPDRQEPTVKVLVSTEHKGLTPVFGTAQPPSGISGVLRQIAFKYSEGRKLHWMLLLLADRVNVIEGIITGLLKGRPDHPIQEMGLASEFKRHGFRSRFGRGRADVRRQGKEALIILGVGAAVFLASRAVRKR
jgi:hypothetical protein